MARLQDKDSRRLGDAVPRLDEHLQGPLDGLRVLVVDDNPDHLYILQTVLNGAGASVQTAHSAQEAFDAFEVNPPDVLVSDLSMPMATGYTLIRRIRSLPDGASLPAVAMTAFHAEEHWQKAMDAGFNEWLPKPAHDLVVRAVARLVGREWA